MKMQQNNGCACMCVFVCVYGGKMKRGLRELAEVMEKSLLL